MKRSNFSRGFTLIELMIVIAIIGILAAIAIPAYQNYTIRSQVTEGLTLGDGWKTAIAEYYATTGAWPTQSNLTGTCNSFGKYESSVSVVAGGIIQIIYGSQANSKVSSKTLTIVPYTNANNDILWQCGTATMPAAGVTSSGGTTSGTTVSAQYLPTSCHS
jgi:type IV pilus assembly protein PilA